MTLRAPWLLLRCPPRDSLCRSAVLTAFRARAGPRASRLATVGRPLPAWVACFVCPFVFFFRFRVKVKSYSVCLHLSFLNDDDYFLHLADFTRHSTFLQRGHTDGQQPHGKVLDITSHQGHANRNYSEMPPCTCAPVGGAVSKVSKRGLWGGCGEGGRGPRALLAGM